MSSPVSDDTAPRSGVDSPLVGAPGRRRDQAPKHGSPERSASADPLSDYLARCGVWGL